MGLLNFSAYSAMVTNWVNPGLMLTRQGAIESALSSSNISVHASDLGDIHDSLESLTQKVVLTDPDIVYSRSYDSDRLLSGFSRGSDSATFSVTPYENRIIIPRLGKNIPLVDVDHDPQAKFGEMQDVFMEELKKGVVRYPGTARPGEIGNAFIFGHSSNYPWIKSEYNDVFALIDTLQNGDEIIVYYNQHKYIYRITDRVIVEPGNTKVLSARDPNKKEISLMTCWPVGTALNRYIIFGELVENQ
ncbi:class E sortase [Candidatus Gracilibacteria bacterium]|nr:class E sortase [Candidatus Gracilibacteria bacterium]